MTTVSLQSKPQHVLRGVVLIVTAMFVTSLQDVIFKLFSSQMPLGQIFALRALLALPLIFLLARWRGFPAAALLADAFKPWALLRALFYTLCFLAFYAALPFLSLSTVGAANYVAPIFVALLSAYAIAEPVGARGWIAVFVGFAGVLALLQPGSDAFSPWALLPLLGALFYALGNVTTRTKCQSTPLITMVTAVTLVMLCGGLAVSAATFVSQPAEDLVRAYPSLLGSWSMPSAADWLILGLLSFLTIVIAFGIAGAYQVAPPSTVATFDYSYLVFAALWDIVIFQIWPAWTTVLGMSMIACAGIMVFRKKP
ncbi:MAG: DMT family transporter [Pseudomonadota bacterium]